MLQYHRKLLQLGSNPVILKLPHQNFTKIQVHMAFWKKLELSKMEKRKVGVRYFSET